MSFSDPLRAARAAANTVGSYFKPHAVPDEASGVASSRALFKDAFPLERFLAFGSCIPLVSNSIGVARIFYGTVLLSYALAELTNKIAVASFSKDAPLTEKLVVLKDGVAFSLLKGAVHIVMGLTAQASILGNISCAVYEFALRPYLFPPAFNIEPTVDPKSFEPLMERVKQHSFYLSVQRNVAELGRLVLGTQPAQLAPAANV